MDYYKILNITKDASQEEIKKSYRKLVLKCHPDKNINRKEDAEKEFKSITEAYTVLSDVKKRKEYDLSGKLDDSNFIVILKNFINKFMIENKDIIEDLKKCENTKELKFKILYYIMKGLLT